LKINAISDKYHLLDSHSTLILKKSLLMTKLLSTVYFLAFSAFAFSQYPASYDLRNFNLVTPVKDQGSCGAWLGCFASCAAIESQWLKAGFPAADLSEDNLIDCHGFDEAPCAGGSFYMTQAMLSYHKGIFTEAVDPYTGSTQNCPGGPFPPAPEAFVEDMLFIPGTQGAIKSAILTHGAVASTMYFTMSNYNAGSYTYYDATIDVGDYPNAHCVTIVGWDDNLSVSGAPGNGAWIIKDSYGTTWANNGYFYCSYYDAGILTENAVFPVRYEYPTASNRPHLYAHDEFGWVDNYGYANPTAYALAKYTLLPNGPMINPQQIRRVGTYAVGENMSIQFDLYRAKNGNVLSDLIASETITTNEVGYYSVPLQLPTDTLQTDIYIKVSYFGGTGLLNPIPIEKYELNHTSSFVASSNSGWISPDGSNWTMIGGGTSFSFDPCIKLYTEDAAYAQFDAVTPVCQNEVSVFQESSVLLADSVQWLIDGTYVSNMSTFQYTFTQSGNTDVSLVAWLGDLSDTLTQTVIVYPSPALPTIAQNGNQLQSSTAMTYQWLDDQLNPIPNETNQTFNPISEGVYYVQITDANGCSAISSAYNFMFVSLQELENSANRELIRITDLMGRLVEPRPGMILLFVYNDGTVEKKYIVD
jgi:C1A family cysteine protease